MTKRYLYSVCLAVALMGGCVGTASHPAVRNVWLVESDTAGVELVVEQCRVALVNDKLHVTDCRFVRRPAPVTVSPQCSNAPGTAGQPNHGSR